MTRYETAMINTKPQGLFGSWEHMHTMRKFFGFAIPNEEALQIIAEYSPILEVGAGNGYWAFELKERGGDIITTEPLKKAENKYEQVSKGQLWVEPENLSANEAIQKYPNRTLMMIWPCYDDPWAYFALKEYKGQYFIFVGEGQGGCTAEDMFFNELERNWEMIHDVWIPRHDGIHDYLSIHRRNK